MLFVQLVIARVSLYLEIIRVRKLQTRHCSEIGVVAVDTVVWW